MANATFVPSAIYLVMTLDWLVEWRKRRSQMKPEPGLLLRSHQASSAQTWCECLVLRSEWLRNSWAASVSGLAVAHGVSRPWFTYLTSYVIRNSFARVPRSGKKPSFTAWQATQLPWNRTTVAGLPEHQDGLKLEI
jgi:hypothetical protein